MNYKPHLSSNDNESLQSYTCLSETVEEWATEEHEVKEGDDESASTALYTDK